MTDLADRGGVCLCGGVGTLSLWFGGRRQAHFRCDQCKRNYDLDGNLLDD